MDLQNLIMEGVRRIDERGRLAEFFPDLNMIVESVGEPGAREGHRDAHQGRVAGLLPHRRPAQPGRGLPPGGQPRRAGDPPDPAPPGGRQVRSARDSAPRDGGRERRARRAASRCRPGRILRQGPEPPAGPVQVAFSPGSVSAKIGDDTKDIVSPQAVQYLDSSSKITVSRLVLLKDGPRRPFRSRGTPTRWGAIATTTS